MPTCIYSRQHFEHANKEHILQNALGARWASGQIVCNELQEQFGETIDLALTGRLQAIRTHFGTESGRGKSSPSLLRLETASGQLIDVEAGGQPRLSEPIVEFEELPDGHVQVHIELADKKQIDWAIAKVRAKYPRANIDREAFLSTAETRTEPLTEPIRLPFTLGGPEYFRGMLKSCFNLLAMNYRDEVMLPCFDPLRLFIATGVGDLDQHNAFAIDPAPLDLPRLGPIDHGIFIINRGRAVQGVIRFFGELIHVFKLTDGYDAPTPIHCGYVVDPLREAEPAEDKTPIFTPGMIPEFHGLPCEPTSSAQVALHAQVCRIFDKFFARARNVDHIIRGAIQDAWGAPHGQVITPEMIARLSAAIDARMIAAGLLPSETPDTNK